MNENAKNWPTVTASPARDLVIFMALFAVMLLLSERLRVYYAVTVVDVTVARILPNGRLETLPTPRLCQAGRGLLEAGESRGFGQAANRELHAIVHVVFRGGGHAI